MSERARKSADRIREEIPLIEVLDFYGYRVDITAPDRQQQFSCDLHGDGRDGKPSARYYPDTGQFFCFACGQSRDAIGLVREKEGMGFWAAIRKLEAQFSLSPLPWEADAEDRPATPRQAVEDSLRRDETPQQAMHRVERFLMNLTRERSLPAVKCAGLWEAHDRVLFHLDNDGKDSEVLRLAHRVLSAAKEALQAKAQGEH
jgi:hypothetical protein